MSKLNQNFYIRRLMKAKLPSEWLGKSVDLAQFYLQKQSQFFQRVKNGELPSRAGIAIFQETIGYD